MAKKKAPTAKTTSVKTHALDTPKYLQIRGQDEGKHYRFVQRNDESIGRREMQGYAVTNDPDKKIKGPRHEGGATLGTHDLVLMETSFENRDARQRAPEQRSLARIDRSIQEAGTENTTHIAEESLPKGQDPDNIFNN